MIDTREEYPYSDNDNFASHYEIQDYDAPSPSPYDVEEPSAEYRPDTAEALRMLLAGAQPRLVPGHYYCPT